jgi:methyltransferase (TIGR00027 family)
MLRAFGARERDAAVRNPDYMAEELVDRRRVYRLGLWLASMRSTHAIGSWAFEKVAGGAYWAETARVKHFDEILAGELASGIRQVIVLGAGLDSRAYRLGPRMSGVSFFEVDHPVMAVQKRDRVERILGSVPPYVTLVAHDLTVEDPGQSLADAGFDASSPVLVLWIGVSMYLPADAVEGVLAWAGGLSAGSSFGFDYLEQRFFDDERPFRLPRRTRFLLGLSGERLIYGIDPASLEELLGAHGFKVKSHIGPDESTARYLRRSNGRIAGRPFAYSRYVHAGVHAT